MKKLLFLVVSLLILANTATSTQAHIPNHFKKTACVLGSLGVATLALGLIYKYVNNLVLKQYDAYHKSRNESHFMSNSGKKL